MSDSRKTFVIVGASLAGAKAAEAMREEGFEGRIVMIGSESERPYERPPLSKDFLRGETDDVPYVHEEDYYAVRDVELWPGSTVTAIDASAGEVETADGERTAFDALLLATGAEPKRLDLPGADLEGVHLLRSLESSRRLGRELTEGRRVVVIGAGWIGCEVAASARQKGCEVTIVESAAVPLERVMGAEVGAIYRDLHADHGVRFVGGARIEAIEGAGSVESVRLAGEALEAELVVMGVGVAPRTELAEAAGLAVDDGVLVDAALRSSAPSVFAAGDVANAEHPFYGRRVRVEHWANARKQGAAAGRSMLGLEVAYDEIPYFFSDQYDLGMEYGGLVDGYDEVLFRGDVEGREFVSFWLKDGVVRAGMNVNVWDVNEAIRELVRSRARVERDRLADPDVPIEELAA